MQIVIDIPKEFERDWNETKFVDCIHRAMCDLRDYPNHDKITGNYEMETLEMLRNTFENGIPLPKGHGRILVVSEDIIKREQIPLSFSCQSWISEVGLSNATIAIIEADKTESEANNR